ncbi:Plasmodium exported protein (hyp15), unknown function [Plasmodium sp. gorilla clade G3]|nr:Plasmodium exported protein (hyp15), unknown function [Plasmodium sp. gorilla clade G3]
MNFFHVKIYSLLFILRIFEVFHTDDINIFKYKHENHVWVEKFILFRSLCEVLKEKNIKTQITECDLIYEKLEKENSQEYSNLIKSAECDYYYKRKKQREKTLQDKIVRHEMNEYYNMRNKLIIDKPFSTSEYNEIIKHYTKRRIKDILYKMIFKGKNFWKNLSYTLRTLGTASTICLLIVCFAPCAGSTTLIAPVLGVWGVFVFLVIILIVGSWFLTTWLWPHKDSYNKKYRV